LQDKRTGEKKYFGEDVVQLEVEEDVVQLDVAESVVQ
jgi:hypothetical protein